MKNEGVTLVELMFGIAIVAILLAFALPSYRTTVQNNQLVACANKLVAAIQLAKSEAITSRETVHVAIDETTYRVGVDANGNNTVENPELLQILECSGEGLSVTPDPAALAFVSFSAIGFRDDGQGTVSLTTCNSQQKGKVLNLSTGGGITNADAAAGDCP